MTKIATTKHMKETKRELPDGWRWVRLGEVCKFINGDAYRESDWSSAGIQIIRIQNLNDERKPFNYWEGEVDDRVCVKPGDLLLAWSGTPGTSFGAHIWNRGPGVLNQHIFLVHVNESLDKVWAKHAINNALDDLIKAAHGAVGLAHVTKREVEALQIPLPSLAQQQRIVGILRQQIEAVAKARAAAQARLAAVKELPAAYLRQVFPQPGHPLPAGWRWVKLREMCFFKRGPFGGSLKKEVFTENGYRVYEQQHAIKNDFEIGSYYISEQKFREMEAFSLCPGELIISCSGTMGRVAVAPANVKSGIINQALLKLTPVFNQIVPEYLKLCLESEPIQIRYFRATAGAAIKNVASVSQLKEIPVPLPSLSEQKKITMAFREQIAAVDKARAGTEEELQTINALPAALMRRAFNGEL